MNPKIFATHNNSINPRAVQYGLHLAGINDFDHFLTENSDVALGVLLKEGHSRSTRSEMLENYFDTILSAANDCDHSDFADKLSSAFKLLGPETKRLKDQDLQLQLHSFIIYLSSNHSYDVKRIKSMFAEHLLLPSDYEAYYHDCLFHMVNNHSFNLNDKSRRDVIARANRISTFDFDFIISNDWFHALANPSCPNDIIDAAFSYILDGGDNFNVFHVARNQNLSEQQINILSDLAEDHPDRSIYLNALYQNPAYYESHILDGHVDFSKLKDIPELKNKDLQFKILLQYINQGHELDRLVRSFTTPGLLRFPLENKLTGKLDREQRMHLLELLSDKSPQIAMASIFNSVDLLCFIKNNESFPSRFQDLASAHITYGLSRNSDNNFDKLQLFMHALSTGAINPDKKNPYLFLQGKESKATSPIEFILSELNQGLINEISAKILEVKASRSPTPTLKMSSKIKMP